MLVPIQRRCDGSALIIALLILIIMTILGISTVTTSTQEMIMAGNTQDSSASFQASEAGIAATMSLVGGSDDPFTGKPGTVDPLAPFVDNNGDPKSTHPLKDILLQNTGNIISVEVETVQTDATCPRKAAGSSVDLITCENYQVDSTHASATTGAFTRINQGVQRELLAK